MGASRKLCDDGIANKFFRSRIFPIYGINTLSLIEFENSSINNRNQEKCFEKILRKTFFKSTIAT